MAMTNAVLSRENRLLRDKIERDFDWITQAKEIMAEARDEILNLRAKLDEMQFTVSLLIKKVKENK